jgi:DNA replication protein DnaD
MGLSRNRNWKEKGLKIIMDHKGKKQTYEAFQKKDPKMAEEYVRFISKNAGANYISWDKEKKKFSL